VALYTNDSKERVRDAVDMIDLVNARTELKRAGVNRYTGLCPFHDERTPSFGINPAEKVYYCFGCQASGDAFTFVMETEGVDFKGALELLADRYKVALELEDEDPQAAERRQRNERLMELLERTATYYVRQLWESAEAERAREYLAARGLEEGTLREFRVGYAPSAWDTVMKASLRARFKAQELDAAGLLSSNEKTGRKYDRFRSQIIFPLADTRGRVRGFAGRTLVPDADRRGPKYVNSPESHLFHKREQLFGADVARAPAAKAGSVVVAEGYTDVIAMHQAGIRNSVAIMGTAMTEEQLAGLARLAPVMRLALDSDSAGKEAMLRTARLAKNRRVEIEVVALVAGEDPADLLRRAGGEELVKRIAEAVPFVRFSVHRAIETGDLDDARGKDQILAQISAMWKLVPSGVEHEELVRTISNRLDLPPDLVAGELNRRSAAAPAETRPASAPAGGGDAAPRVATALGRRERTERAFLGYCLALPKLGAPALEQLDLDADLSSPLIRRAAAHLRAHLDAPTEGLPDHDPELARLIAELAVRATELSASAAAFEAERLQLALARLDREIAAARSAAAGDVSELAGRRSAMQTQLSGALAKAMEEGERTR
jgi:DNA primase